jgi:hypothetical protein
MNTSNSSSYNPFQKQNNRNQYRSEGSGGYGAWKNKTAAASQPKEKVLTAADFPLLPGATPGAKPVNTKEMPETSMAARMKEVLEEEEEQKRLRQLKEKDDFELHVIPLSSWMHSKYLAEKRERERKRREIEEEEENYRWQISRDMTYTREDDDYTEPYEELPPLEEAEDSQQYELEEVA